MNTIAVLIAQVSVTPTAKGMPGAHLIMKLLAWCQMVALWGSVAAVLVGAALYGFSRESGSFTGASRGKAMVGGGIVGALLAGAAPAAVNLLFKAARG